MRPGGQEGIPRGGDFGVEWRRTGRSSPGWGAGRRARGIDQEVPGECPSGGQQSVGGMVAHGRK